MSYYEGITCSTCGYEVCQTCGCCCNSSCEHCCCPEIDDEESENDQSD